MASMAIRWVVLAAAIFVASLPAAAERRVALVVGNSAYANTTTLANPLNDARVMSEALRATGFDVVEALDADKKKLDGALRAFTDKLSAAEVALFYYAGHGLQVGAQNYLVPTDARLERERDLEFEAVKLDFVLRQMEIEREGKTSIVILDACRDNPLARTLARSMGTRSAGVGRGLAAAATGLGTFIAYATQPGNVALDGEGKNSPFTSALAKHMRTKGRNLNATMIEVRRDVVAATNGAQVPWDHSALNADFYFLPGEASAGQGTVSAAPAGNAADLAALQARLAKLEAEAKERETTKPSPSPAPATAAQQADAMKLAELRKRSGDLEELLGSLIKRSEEAQQRANNAREGSVVRAEQIAAADKIAAEIERRAADLLKLDAEIAVLERGKRAQQQAATTIPPVTPKAKPQKVSPDFEEADNVSLNGVKLSSSRMPSPLACREACERTSGCEGFQHGKKSANMGMCELYSLIEARNEDANWRSGVRTAWTAAKLTLTGDITEPQHGFVTARGQSITGDIIENATADSAVDCLLLCSNTQTCIAASYDASKSSSCATHSSVKAVAPSASGTAILKRELVGR